MGTRTYIRTTKNRAKDLKPMNPKLRSLTRSPAPPQAQARNRKELRGPMFPSRKPETQNSQPKARNPDVLLRSFCGLPHPGKQMSCVWEGFEARELLRGLSLEERSFQFRALGCLKDLEFKALGFRALGMCFQQAWTFHVWKPWGLWPKP